MNCSLCTGDLTAPPEPVDCEHANDQAGRTDGNVHRAWAHATETDLADEFRPARSSATHSPLS